MQVIYKVDIIFILIYSFIILITGLFLFLSSTNLLFLVLTVIGEMVYLFFVLKSPYRRHKALKEAFPEEWRNFLEKRCRFYRCLDKEGKKHFEQDMQIFLSDFSIEGIRRQRIDEKTGLLVAAGFATLLFGRPYWEPPIKDGVIVYPGKSFSQDYRIGRGTLAGQASVNSPLIVTQESLEESFKDADDGYNVIFHELAHYFDLEDGRAEGIPSTRMLAQKLKPWKNAISREWKKALSGRSFLRPYAGKSEAELFAVATEFFFENPGVMKRKNLELYNVLKDFYNIDPASIIDSKNSDR